MISHYLGTLLRKMVKVADAKTFAALNTKEVTRSYEQPDGSTVTVKYYADANGNIASAPYYDKDGNRLIVDGSEIGDVYAYKAKDGVVSLQKHSIRFLVQILGTMHL